MALEKLFHSALFGYKKNEVMQYIEQMDIRYTDTVSQHDGHVKTLQSELDELQSVKAECESLKLEISSLKAEKDDLQAVVLSQGEQLSHSKAMADEAAEYKSKYDYLVTETNRLRDKYENKENQISDLDAQLETLKTQLSELKEKNSTLSCEKATLERSVNRLRDSEEAKDFQITELEEHLEELTREMSDCIPAEEVEAMLEQTRVEAKEVIDRANQVAQKIISDAKAKVENAEKEAETQRAVKSAERAKAISKRKTDISEIFREHKSKMDSFFSSITDSFKDGDK